MVKNSSRNRGRQGRRLDPNLYVLEDASIATADTAVNGSMLTNDKSSRMMVRMRRATLMAFGGNTGARVLWIIRRVPQGYTPPSITVTSGLTVFADQADILGYGIADFTSDNGEHYAKFTWIRRTTVLYEGDYIALQCVTNTSSTGLLEAGEIEFGSKFV